MARYRLFLSPFGALLSEFNCLSTCTLIYNRIYFGGMVLGTDGTTVNGTTLSALGDTFTWTDRLGSAQSTYPYGTDIGTYPAGADAVDFATYTKEGSTGLEYAMNRYYSGGLGRFLTADPYGGSAISSNPLSWNRYRYSSNDPVNRYDPNGADDCPADTFCVDTWGVLDHPQTAVAAARAVHRVTCLRTRRLPSTISP